MVQLSEYRSDDKNMIMADVQILANTHMFNHGLLDQGWFFNFDRAKNRFGQCKHGPAEKVISMSKYLTPLRTFEQNMNTILHEIAHALVGPGHGHDDVWRTKALEIGCDGERCGKIDPDTVGPTKRWHAKCPGCGIKGLFFDRAPNRVRSCVECDLILDWYQWGAKMHWSEMPKNYQSEYYALNASAREATLAELLSLEDEYAN